MARERQHDPRAVRLVADGGDRAVEDRGELVVAVGHQPDCSEIYAALTGDDRGFAPGDAAELEL